jgi:hypothetical protein
VDELIGNYLDRMSRADEAFLKDPTYNAHVGWLRRTLSLADMAMQDRGVPDEDRRYVLTVAMYGSPDEEAAMARIAERQRLIEESMRRPMPPIPPDVLAAFMHDPSRGHTEQPGRTADPSWKPQPAPADDSWIEMDRLEGGKR